MKSGFQSFYRVVEKADHLAVHALCNHQEGAERWIAVNAKEYSEKGYFMNKTLTPDSFEILVPSNPLHRS